METYVEEKGKDANFQALFKDRMKKDQFAASSLGHNSIEVGDPTMEVYQPQSDSSDEEFIISSLSCTKSPSICTTLSSLKFQANSKQKIDDDDQVNMFPQIPVRTGYRTIDVNIMETLVVMVSAFKVGERKCTHLPAFIANKIFGQNWSVDTKEDEDDQEEALYEDDNSIPAGPSEKKRKKISNLDFVLPSRKAIHKLVQQFSLLSLRDAATQISDARENNKVVNLLPPNHTSPPPPHKAKTTILGELITSSYRFSHFPTSRIFEDTNLFPYGNIGDSVINSVGFSFFLHLKCLGHSHNA